MTIRIHPAENQEALADLALELLAQAAAEALLKEKASAQQPRPV